MAIIDTDILKAEKLLREGELVAIPTETVYGLAGNALNVEAVTKIFQAKNRPSFDPLIIHTNSLEKVKSFVAEFPPLAQKIAERFWPGAITLLLPKNKIIPDLVTSGLDTVAVRIPRHPLTLRLLEKLEFPLAAPSANPFGYISPTSAEHVQNQLGDKIPFILDGGACEVGIESTIISFEDEVPKVLRLGGTSLEAIEATIGKVEVQAHSNSNPKAPGMLKSHYAPKKAFCLGDLDKVLKEYQTEDIGALAFKEYFPQIPVQNQINLSETGSFAEATQKLFGAMRELDKMNIKVIYTELLPEEDLGRAINDRLRRAAAK